MSYIYTTGNGGAFYLDFTTLTFNVDLVQLNNIQSNGGSGGFIYLGTNKASASFEFTGSNL